MRAGFRNTKGAFEYVEKMDIRAAALQLLKGLMAAIAEKFGTCELLDEN